MPRPKKALSSFLSHSDRAELTRDMTRQLAKLVPDERATMVAVVPVAVREQAIQVLKRTGSQFAQSVSGFQLKLAAATREMLRSGKGRDKILAQMDKMPHTEQTKVKTVLRTAAMAMYRANEFDTELQWYKYVGPPPERSLCRALHGKVFHIDQIRAMKPLGKAPHDLPVILYCGGYNCRHKWIPTEDPDDAEERLAKWRQELAGIKDYAKQEGALQWLDLPLESRVRAGGVKLYDGPVERTGATNRVKATIRDGALILDGAVYQSVVGEDPAFYIAKGQAVAVPLIVERDRHGLEDYIAFEKMPFFKLVNEMQINRTAAANGVFRDICRDLIESVLETRKGKRSGVKYKWPLARHVTDRVRKTIDEIYLLMGLEQPVAVKVYDNPNTNVKAATEPVNQAIKVNKRVIAELKAYNSQGMLETLAHEMGHVQELRDPAMHRAALSFFKAEMMKGAEQAPQRSERYYVVELKNEDVNDYYSRVYTDGLGGIIHTELLSLNWEKLYANDDNLYDHPRNFVQYCFQLNVILHNKKKS